MASSWIPIHDTRSSQEKDPKTDAIVRRYHKSSLTNPVLHEILKNPEESSLLLDAVRRQVSLIKCRSQDFEDGQVTIYDRALLILTNNGENMTDLGARELYLTEFLGIVPIGPVAPSKDIVARHVALQSKLTKASDSIEDGIAISKDIIHNDSDNRTSAMHRYDTKNDHHHRDQDERHHHSDRAKTIHTYEASQTQSRIERLMEVYAGAKKEYFDGMRRDGMVSIEMARFLRDSAENALRYMLNNSPDDRHNIQELEEVFAIARDKATELFGGRKRHFDQGHERRRKKNGRGRRVDSYRPH